MTCPLKIDGDRCPAHAHQLAAHGTHGRYRSKTHPCTKPCCLNAYREYRRRQPSAKDRAAERDETRQQRTARLHAAMAKPQWHDGIQVPDGWGQSAEAAARKLMLPTLVDGDNRATASPPRGADHEYR